MNMENDKLKAAAEEGDINLLYTVIQEDPHVLEHSDVIPFVETPLQIAASVGHLHFATEIMRLKASFAWKLNQQGFSPVHLALQHGQTRMVQRFVDINKDLVRVKGREGVTPLHFVCQNGDIDLLANFLSACPDSIEDVNVRGETALHIAVKNKQYETLQVLIGWLKRTRHRGAMKLEKTILNWKDEAGNTILHTSALLNDSQAIELLINSKMDSKAKNLENLTALDIAVSAEMKKLMRAGAKSGLSVTESPILAHNLRSKFRIMDKILIYILRIRGDISEDQRNAFLVVAALVATATYQAALNPPGGFYQANAGDNSQNVSSLNATVTTTQGKVGTSVMSEGDFFTLLIMNTLAFLVSTTTIYILTPNGIVGKILSSPMYGLAYCYMYSVKVISPTSTTKQFSLIMLYVFIFLFFVVSYTFDVVCKRFMGYAQEQGNQIAKW